MYHIYGKSKTVDRTFESLLRDLEETEKKKLMTTLAKAPKGLPPNLRSSENFGRVEKKNKRFWQYYLDSSGWRVIYEVIDRPKQVIIQFIGDHEDAGAFLRQNG